MDDWECLWMVRNDCGWLVMDVDGWEWMWKSGNS